MKTEKQSGSPIIIYILCRWWQKYILYSLIFIFIQYIFCIKLFAPLYCNFLVVIHVTNCYTRGGMVLTCDKGQKTNTTKFNLYHILCVQMVGSPGPGWAQRAHPSVKTPSSDCAGKPTWSSHITTQWATWPGSWSTPSSLAPSASAPWCSVAYLTAWGHR